MVNKLYDWSEEDQRPLPPALPKQGDSEDVGPPPSVLNLLGALYDDPFVSQLYQYYNVQPYDYSIGDITLPIMGNSPPPVQVLIRPASSVIMHKKQPYWYRKAAMMEAFDNVELIFLPFRDLTPIEDNQISNQVQFSSDHLADESVELITLPYNTWEQDSDNEIAQLPYSLDRDLMDTGVENIIIPYRDLTLEADNQKQWAEYYKDHLSDESVELIIIPPFVTRLYAYDTDAENQINTEVKFAYAEDPTDRTVLIFTPFIDRTLDTEQQLSNQIQFRSDTLSDESVELVILPLVYEQDLDNQHSNQISYIDHLSDESVENIIVPYRDLTLEADNQLQWLGYYKDHLSDEGVELIIVPPSVSRLYAYDTDAENQISNQVNYSFMQDPDDRAIRIVIPTQAYDTDADQQLPIPGYQGVWSDQGQDWTEYIILSPGIVREWDTDVINQIPFPDWYRDEWEYQDLYRQIFPPPVFKKPTGRVYGVQGTMVRMSGGVGQTTSAAGSQRQKATSTGDEGTQANVQGSQKDKGDVEN